MAFEITIDTHGLLDAFARIPVEIKKALHSEMKEQLRQVRREARLTHRHSHVYQPIQFAGQKRRKVVRPYRLTGNLNLSVTDQIDPSGLIGEVGLDLKKAYYGVYVHEGHGTHDRPAPGYYSWKPDRFLDAALLNQEPQIRVGLEAALEAGCAAAGAL